MAQRVVTVDVEARHKANVSIRLEIGPYLLVAFWILAMAAMMIAHPLSLHTGG